MKKVRAFSLIELLVAMVISSVVIASAYFMYSMFSKDLIDYKGHINKLSDAVVLNGILEHDINLAQAVKKNSSNGIRIEQGSANIDYEWQEDAVLRKTDLSTDTFHLFLKDVELNFMNTEQTVTGSLIDVLKFNSSTDGREITFSFEKKYGSDMLVKSENKPYGRH
jgi:prepilin-type N-terminal cleavage/methylation domain-containing protein